LTLTKRHYNGCIQFHQEIKTSRECKRTHSTLQPDHNALYFLPADGTDVTDILI